MDSRFREFSEEAMDRNLTADAKLCSSGSKDTSSRSRKLSVQKIEELEREMNIYQKVSLVFLLYPDLDLALQRLQAVEAHLKTANHSSSLNEICLLSDWASTIARRNGQQLKENNNVLPDECGTAFVEALSIVQDFELLYRNGFGDRNSGTLTREMSLDVPEEHCINHARNVLYRLCENLHPKFSEELVRRVESERPELARRYPPDARLLEVTLLYWASQRYITITKGCGVDVRNIVRHLLDMGESKMAAFLEKHLPYQKETSNNEDRQVNDSSEALDDDDNLPLLCSQSSDKTGNTSTVVVDIEKMEVKPIENKESLPSQSITKKITKTGKNVTYEVNSECMGYCVIINQKNFYMDPDPGLQPYLPHAPFEDRLGTDVDRDRLTEAFTSLGFKIIVKTNLQHNEILSFAHQLAQSKVLKSHSCLVFCVLSHGQKDTVFGCNSVPVSIMELVEIFCGSKCPALINKPKIFIIQACQGSKLQQTKLSNIGTDGPIKSPAGVKDYVKFLSTVPGYVSLRHKVKGSWFIDTLSEEIICREPNCSLIDVFTQVNASVDKKSSVVGDSLVSMMSELRTTLRGPVYLPVDPDSMKKAVLLSIQRALFEKLLEEFHNNLSKNHKKGRKTKWY